MIHPNRDDFFRLVLENMVVNKKIKEEFILVTQDGLDELNVELKLLREDKRPDAVMRLQSARDMGDLSENSEYSSAKLDLEFIDERITSIETKLKKAKVVVKSTTTKTVGIGSKVTVVVAGKQITYEIVGEGEADPKEKKVSHNSPIGEALKGKKEGDAVKVKAPVGIIEYAIKEIK